MLLHLGIFLLWLGPMTCQWYDNVLVRGPVRVFNSCLQVNRKREQNINNVFELQWELTVSFARDSGVMRDAILRITDLAFNEKLVRPFTTFRNLRVAMLAVSSLHPRPSFLSGCCYPSNSINLFQCVPFYLSHCNLSCNYCA